MSSFLDRTLGLVWNREERRPRAPVRLVAVALVFLLVGQAISAVFAALSDQYQGGVFSLLFAGTTLDVAIQTGSTLFGALTAVISAVVLALVVDRRRFSDYGFRLDRAWWRDFGFGAGLGVGLMTLLFLVSLGAGWLRVTGFGVASEGFSPGVLVVSYLLTFAGVSLSEELLVRGVILTNIAEGAAGVGPFSERAGSVLAVALTSLLFGVLHAGNPNATVVSTASIALAGVFLAAGYALTGELAVPLGLHLTWNYAQGVMYGFPVSGTRVGVAIIETELTGPTLLTGGRFGPEAGLLGVAAVLLGTGLIAWWVRRTRGGLALSPMVWTPEFRWRDAE